MQKVYLEKLHNHLLEHLEAEWQKVIKNERENRQKELEKAKKEMVEAAD